MVSASGDWDWPQISPLLPQEVLDQIAAIQPPQGWLDSDTPGWRWTVSRQFTTASAHAFIMDTDLSSIDPIWKKIWSLPIPQRDRCSAVLGSDYNLKDDILFRGNRLVDECIQSAANKFQTSPSLSSTGLVASILRLTEYDWELVIRHVPREGNALADRLSKWGRIHSPETVILVHPPSTLNALVNAEKGSGLRDPLLVQDWLRDATAACFNLRADPGG
ncbi:hypothetical protein V6N12_069497 [Hibiscus sabdariffa]|uniref:RNase H type-1 domain-containing protein n=1 Tax=Hibiscus sabdariffa TaxID=183260 RepID=A0ABR2FE08_9ROSI